MIFKNSGLMIIHLGLMREDKMMGPRIVLCLVILLFVMSTIPGVTAGECCYGSVHAWFKESGGSWENATAHSRLKRGETFEIKIVVTSKTDLQVFFVKLHEFGTPVFEVLQGPTEMEQLLECRQRILSNQTFSYVWKLRVRPETPWVNGYGPLEVFVQCNRNDAERCQVSYDVLVAYVVDQRWEGYIQEDRSENISLKNTYHRDLSGFEFEVILITVFLLFIIRRLKEQAP